MLYIDRTCGTPLYLQLYRQLLDQILSGQIPAGQLLPGSRALAADLGLGRNTVDNAYGQLAMEGYIQTEPGRGFRVLALPQLLSDSSPQPVHTTAPPPASRVAYDLIYGRMSPRDFPFSQWRKELLDVLDDESRGEINSYPDHKGDILLREQLVKELFQSRGVTCSPQQIVITSGLQGSLEILCKLLYPSDGVHAFEEPSYDRARLLFQQHSIPMVSIALDDAGALPSSLPADRPVTSVYLTPSHQFPLGILMPIQRRYEFLNWALEHNAYLIEDDYDSDYSYHTNPVPALQSIDTNGRVIYLGSFSKSLSPSMRMAYMVLPPALAHRYDTHLRDYNCMVPWLMQRTLAQFMANGHYRRLVRRLRTRFRKTHDLLQREIRQLSPDIQIISQGYALKFLLAFPPHMTREWLMDRALEQGVRVYSPERFWQDPANCPPNLILLGFTAMEPEEISLCMERLKTAWFPE
ncbi:MAG: PLP-dependent aminotransferase family protein [Ruminiclostridium sp.]|nr:PLP-dependent aminotransferase family protein [Ruminiclostridium sp.]